MEISKENLNENLGMLRYKNLAYQFPIAIITNYQIFSTLKLHKCILLQFQRSESKIGKQGCIPFRGSGKNVSMPFLVSKDPLHSLARGPILYLKVSSVASFSLSLSWLFASNYFF